MYSSSFQQRYHFPNWCAVRGLHDCNDIITRKKGPMSKWSKCSRFLQQSVLTNEMNPQERPRNLCMCVACLFLPKNSQFNYKSQRLFFYIPEYLGSGNSCWCGYPPVILVSLEAAIQLWEHKKQELRGPRCVCCLLTSCGFLNLCFLNLGVKGHRVWWLRVRPQIQRPRFKSWCCHFPVVWCWESHVTLKSLGFSYWLIDW